MLFYRYRPSGELSLKELRYNEIYFSSQAESNDPYDGKVFLSYNFDKVTWERLLKAAWCNIKDVGVLSLLTDCLSSYVLEKSLTTYEEVISCDYKSFLLKNIPRLDEQSAFHLELQLKQFLNVYRPSIRYTVSFSKTSQSLLMWSHYASKHKGYCLVFRAIDDCLYQDKKRKITSIHRKTTHGFAPSMSFGLPEQFKFCDVKYCEEIQMIDAARFMPASVFGRELVDESERIKFASENADKCLEKHTCWSYEEETRILFGEPSPWLFGGHFEYSKEERLLHYQPTQLVGIVFGALIEQSEKERMREIINLRLEDVAREPNGCAVFDFVFFQANISDRARDVTVVPQEICGLSQAIVKGHSDFPSRFKKWEEGWALVFTESGGCTKKQFR